MSAPSTPPSPRSLDTSAAGPCLYCPCCRGIFPSAFADGPRACYGCAIRHGIEIRSPQRILGDGQRQRDDLVTALSFQDTIESISLAIECIERKQGQPAPTDVGMWLIDHEFNDNAMRAGVREWNSFVHDVLGNLPQLDESTLSAKFTRLSATLAHLGQAMEATLLEYEARVLLEEVGALPEFLRCPAANYWIPAGAY